MPGQLTLEQQFQLQVLKEQVRKCVTPGDVVTLESWNQMNTVNEIWKDIPGYEGYYQVSSLGRVKSLRRVHKKPHAKTKKLCDYSVPERLMSLSRSCCSGRRKKKYYLRVGLSKDGITKTFGVHRLVALSFIENPERKPQVNHIDGNPLNNALDNLEWVTNSENQVHAFENGLKGDYSWIKKGKNDPRSKAVNQLSKAGDFIARFDNAGVAANKLSLP